MGQRQVNVRLDDADIEILEAAAFLDGRTLSDEARTALLSHVAEVRRDPLVKKALEVRAERAKAKAKAAEEKVSSLDAKRDQVRTENA